MNEQPAVYLPDNEPYLGRDSVFHFDQIILGCLERNAVVAPYTHRIVQSALQRAACKLIPQGINIALAIRELVRQGYLFPALVLMRPLIERTATISYLINDEQAASAWERGDWKGSKGPGLSKMLEEMAGAADVSAAKFVCRTFHEIDHADPGASKWNLVSPGEAGLGYAVSKVLDNPELCDFICYQSYCYLIVLTAAMGSCFPDALQTE